MRIQDLMSADVVSVTPATTIGEARERMRIAEIGWHGVGVIKIGDCRRKVGFAGQQDVLSAAG